MFSAVGTADGSDGNRLGHGRVLRCVSPSNYQRLRANTADQLAVLFE